MLFFGAALVACPAVADETTILFNVTIAYILYFYVCLMYNKAIRHPHRIVSASSRRLPLHCANCRPKQSMHASCARGL